MTNSIPKISIVTIVLNRRDYIRAAIENVMGQRYSNFEHIVIDGASTDGTLEIIKSYPHLRWISERDAGSVFALNKGLAMVEGEIVGWLNSDELYKPGIFQWVTEYFEQHAKCDLVHGTYQYIDSNGVVVGGTRFHRFNLHRQILGLNVIGAPSAMFMRRRALEAVGGRVDERWRDAYDTDLWIRIGKLSGVDSVNKSFSLFTLHADSGITSDPWRSWREARLIRKHHGGDRRIIDRFFWIPYAELTVKLFRLLKWSRMSNRATGKGRTSTSL